ncbi:MAG: hypothetical protein J5962_05055 [Lachnospiraceae bacterium]|nr:hypothetical protein [Lachnospiraceae bacterium]
MKKIWEFFDNMGEHVYVSDMDRHELIYLRRMQMVGMIIHMSGLQTE